MVLVSMKKVAIVFFRPCDLINCETRPCIFKLCGQWLLHFFKKGSKTHSNANNNVMQIFMERLENELNQTSLTPVFKIFNFRQEKKDLFLREMRAYFPDEIALFPYCFKSDNKSLNEDGLWNFAAFVSVFHVPVFYGCFHGDGEVFCDVEKKEPQVDEWVQRIRDARVRRYLINVSSDLQDMVNACGTRIS